jgi:hypothetical protein
VVTWVHLYQWGDVIDVKGDGRAKRLGTPALNHVIFNTVIFQLKMKATLFTSSSSSEILASASFL